MIIQDSNIAMASQRKHVQAESFSIGFTGGSKGSFAGTLKNRVDAPKETEEVSSVRTNAAWSRQDKFRHKILDYLFVLLFGRERAVPRAVFSSASSMCIMKRRK